MHENPYTDALRRAFHAHKAVAGEAVWEVFPDLQLKDHSHQSQGGKVGAAMRSLGFIRKQAGKDDVPARGCKRGEMYWLRVKNEGDDDVEGEHEGEALPAPEMEAPF
jgi:hypothetical protein